ncbi:MAG: polysaccharide deacetylase family protein [Egibacteraceae bacterium]
MGILRAALDRSGGSRLLVLGYHNVNGTWCFPSRPGAGRRGLEGQLRALRRVARVVALDQALRDLAEGRPLPPRAVAITFDDGYRDTLELAAPLLAQLGLPATTFLVPGILSGQVNPWWERLGWAFTTARADAVDFEGQRLALRDPAARRRAFRRVGERLKRRDRRQREEAADQLVEALSPTGAYHPQELFCDWDGARALMRAGMAIGSHSMYHAILSEESGEAQHADLLDSRKLLEAELDAPIDLFAYPNGASADYDSTTIAAAEAAGYTHAVTTQDGWNRRSTPPYEIRRFVMYPERGVTGFSVLARDLVRTARARRTA